MLYPLCFFYGLNSIFSNALLYYYKTTAKTHLCYKTQM